MKLRNFALIILALCAILLGYGELARAQDVTEEVTLTPTLEVTSESPVYVVGEDGDFINTFRPELFHIAASALTLIIAGAVLLLGRYGVTVARMKAWQSQYDWLFEITWNTVAKFRVTDVELDEYRREAALTGRDPRLVGAYREIQDLANDLGIPFNLDATIALIERVLHEQKLE